MELKVTVVARALSGTIDHTAPTKLYSHQRRGTLSERPGKSPWNLEGPQMCFTRYLKLP